MEGHPGDGEDDPDHGEDEGHPAVAALLALPPARVRLEAAVAPAEYSGTFTYIVKKNLNLVVNFSLDFAKFRCA